MRSDRCAEAAGLDIFVCRRAAEIGRRDARAILDQQAVVAQEQCVLQRAHDAMVEVDDDGLLDAGRLHFRQRLVDGPQSIAERHA